MRVLIAVALLMMCGALAQKIEPQAAKQEKSQPTSGTGAVTIAPPPFCKDAKFGELCFSKDGWLMQNLPFDIPARDIVEHTGDYPCSPIDKNSFAMRCTPVYSVTGVTCKNVASDWQQRVLLDSADGKHHCYAFYLLESRQ